MKNTLLPLFFLLPLLLNAQQTPRFKTGLDDNWAFQAGERPEGAWQNVSLPHSWNCSDPFDEIPGYYRGTGWYRKVLDGSALPQKDRYFLYFEGANQRADLWVNGQPAGTHLGGYTAFCFDISPWLNHRSDTLLVRVDNRHDPLVPPLKGDFNFYGGIYRDVWLIATDSVHFDLTDLAGPGLTVTTPGVSAETGAIKVRGTVVNDGAQAVRKRVRALLIDAAGKERVGTETTVDVPPGRKNFELNTRIAQPHLWSPADPYLYTLRVQLVDATPGPVRDEVVQPLGYRWYSFNPDQGFSLNGHPLKLIGVNRHQDEPGRANALSDAEHLRDIRAIRDMGANFLRTAHYPQDPAVLEACDRLGLLVSMEIPIDHEQTYDPVFFEHTKTMMQEMIRQNRNHPSVIIWAYMNEMFLGRKTERDSAVLAQIVSFAGELEALTRREDSTRYTMIANHGDFDIYQKAGLTRIPMIVGWNLYFGWYAPDEAGFTRFLERAHRELPDKPLLVTEFGAGADPRIRSQVPLRFDFSQEWQARFHLNHLREISSHPWIAGAAAWLMNDFGSENRIDATPRINNKGLCGFDRHPKDAYFLYKAWLSDKPVLYIGSRDWTRRAGVQNRAEPVCVQALRAYGNVPAAELWCNGKSLGSKTLEQHTAEWEVPFASGENILELRPSGKNAVPADRQVVDFQLLAANEPFNGDLLSLNLGSTFIFTEDLAGTIWLPDTPAIAGPWGVRGGRTYLPLDRGIGTDRDILGTDADPLFQTQRIGIERLQFNLPVGRYSVRLLFAELENKAPGERVFSVLANGNSVLQHIDLSAEKGRYQAVEKTFEIFLNQPGLMLEFRPEAGEAVLNAVQVQRR